MRGRGWTKTGDNETKNKKAKYDAYYKDAVAEWVRASTDDRTIDGSTPTAGDFEFGTLAIPLTLLCQCLSDETLKAVGPFYLVSMPGEVKDPTSPHWNVSLVDSTSHSKSPVCEYAALDAALHSIRRRRRRRKTADQNEYEKHRV